MIKAELDRLNHQIISFKDIITGGWALKFQASFVNKKGTTKKRFVRERAKRANVKRVNLWTHSRTQFGLSWSLLVTQNPRRRFTGLIRFT